MAKSLPPLLFLYLLAFSCFSLLALAIRDRGEEHRPVPFARERGQEQCNECQLDRINALEPSSRVKSEAGVTEFWDPNEDQFRCAGVAFMRRSIEPNGLLLPYFRSAPEFHYVIKGKGIRGLSIPGCPETYQSVSRGESESRGGFQDQHQKVWRIRQGDIFVVPAGVVNWLFNDADEELIVVTLVDTTNEINQLDQSFPRGFFLAGNPQQEFQEEQSEGGQQEDVKNIFAGFDAEILEEIFGLPREIIDRLQSNQDDRQGQIVRAEKLRVIRPPTAREDEQWEERQRGGRSSRGEEEWETRHRQGEREGEEVHRGGNRGKGSRGEGRGSRGEGEEELDERRHHRGQEGEEIHRRGSRGEGREGEEEWEEIHRGGSRGRGSRGGEGEGEWEEIHRGGRGRSQGRGSRGGQEWEEIHRGGRGESRGRGSRGGQEWEQIHRGGRGSRGMERWEETHRGEYSTLLAAFNGLEENVCTAKLRENIDDPSRADVFVPQAGRLTTLNSFNLPILSYLRLSAERGVLYKNALMAPHWNLNAHSLIYATRGSARVQIVNERGQNIFHGELKENQLVVAPQNFVLVKQAGDEGFEWVSFKTNNNAVIQTVAGRTSFIKALPIEVIMNAYQVSREEADKLKNERKETVLFAASSRSARGGDDESERRAVA